jgi:hypothetical protein
MLPKARCDQDGFQHQFTFGSVMENREATQAPPPKTIVICRKDQATIRISAQAADCYSWTVVARFSALAAEAAGEFDRVLCVSSGQSIRPVDDCGAQLTFKFAVPQSPKEPSLKICWGQGAKAGFSTLGVGENECTDSSSPDSSFEAPSLLEIAASTPGVEGSAGSPLYELLEEAKPCYSFICKNTKT